IYSLPLFPLTVVVCPGGLLPLRIFEARYLDMVRNCLRNNTNFGVVTVLPEGEGDADGNTPFARVGTAMKIIEADVETVGLMNVWCQGQHRFHVESYTQQSDGLLIGEVSDIPNDKPMAIPDVLYSASRVLQGLIKSFPYQGVAEDKVPISKPYQFDDCAWVANRWIELLDASLVDKQRLMQLDSPLLRLELIQGILSTRDH
ncbi:MAG: LON peptidase substrate-binding domain-containing protein, partial [Methylophilaceae bacterium]